MTPSEFRDYAHQIVDWMADYLENDIHEMPVKSPVKPGEIKNQIPTSPPQSGEGMDTIFNDFKQIVVPGMTHWQHPKFFAYFPANSSYASVLAEMLTSTLAAQCMLWETSPSATELEERVMEWLREMLGLPDVFTGSLQVSASSSTLIAILSAREKYSGFKINQSGLHQQDRLRVYGSEHIHSSIEKAVRIAGLGSDNYVPIKADNAYSMIPEELEKAITADLAAGYKPICVVAGFGTTSSTAVDPIDQLALICRKYDLWFHVDAAYAGTALILPRYRQLVKGIESADSFVFNPHKWMFTNFDCSAYFVKDENILIRTFSILPEYLKTKTGHSVTNYNEWGIQLGRRFRALKLWFVIRNFGVEGIQKRLEDHLSYARWLEEEVVAHPHFELMVKPLFNLICFRYNAGGQSESALNLLNEQLLNSLNQSGKLYLTHTKLSGKYVIRMCIGQTNVQLHHVTESWEEIKRTAAKLK